MNVDDELGRGGAQRGLSAAEVREYAGCAARLLTQKGAECEDAICRQEDYAETVGHGLLGKRTVEKHRIVPVEDIWRLRQDRDEESVTVGRETFVTEYIQTYALTRDGRLMYGDTETLRGADGERTFAKNDWSELMYNRSAANLLDSYLRSRGIDMTADRYFRPSPAEPAGKYAETDRPWLLDAMYNHYTSDIFAAAEELGIEMQSAVEVDDMNADDLARLLLTMEGREPERPEGK